MSRASSAVESCRIRLLPWRAHTAPNRAQIFSQVASCWAPTGNPIGRPDRSLFSAAASGKHCTVLLRPNPRSSKVTMLNRARSAAGNWGYELTKPAICAPGPPPLTKSVPARCLRSVARCRITAILTVAPSGRP